MCSRQQIFSKFSATYGMCRTTNSCILHGTEAVAGRAANKFIPKLIRTSHEDILHQTYVDTPKACLYPRFSLELVEVR